MTQAGRSPLDPWIDAELAQGEHRILLVDGFNVLHTVLLAGARDSIWWGRGAREELLERIAGWPERSDAIWVAFDGPRPAWSMWAMPRPRGPILHSVFVESADDWIVRRARRATAPARTLVVSADRKVAGRARSAGCEVWSPWAFVAACGGPIATRDAAAGDAPRAGDQALDDAPGDGASAGDPRPSPNVVS